MGGQELLRGQLEWLGNIKPKSGGPIRKYSSNVFLVESRGAMDSIGPGRLLVPIMNQELPYRVIPFGERHATF